MVINKDNIHKYIKNGSILSCANKGITSIEYIPDYISSIYCKGNKLTQLPKLPNNLRILSCSNNNLTNLPHLPESLEYIYCSHNNLPHIITILDIKEHNKLLNRSNTIKSILNDYID